MESPPPASTAPIRPSDHLPPLPRAGAPPSKTRASSERRFEASKGAVRHGNDVEGMDKQVVPAEGAMVDAAGTTPPLLLVLSTDRFLPYVQVPSINLDS